MLVAGEIRELSSLLNTRNKLKKIRVQYTFISENKLVKITQGVNFINVLLKAFSPHRYQKRQKDSHVIGILLYFWDLCCKSKTLVKLTPGALITILP